LSGSNGLIWFDGNGVATIPSTDYNGNSVYTISAKKNKYYVKISKLTGIRTDWTPDVKYIGFDENQDEILIDDLNTWNKMQNENLGISVVDGTTVSVDYILSNTGYNVPFTMESKTHPGAVRVGENVNSCRIDVDGAHILDVEISAEEKKRIKATNVIGIKSAIVRYMSGSETVLADLDMLISGIDVKKGSIVSINATPSTGYNSPISLDSNSNSGKINKIANDSWEINVDTDITDLVLSAEESPEPDTTWQNDYEFDLFSGGIYISKYTGTGRNIIVPSYAIVDGFKYKTILSPSWKGIWYEIRDSIESIVIEDGVKCESYDGLFYNLYNLSTVNIGHLAPSGATNFKNMFWGCGNLTSLDISNLNTQKAINMDYMFYSCSSLSTLNLNNLNTSNVTTMKGIFADCSNLTTLDLSSINTAKVTDMSDMFSGCSSLESLDIHTFSSSNVVNMEGMFREMSKLENLNLNGIDTSSVENMSAMFMGCTSLNQLDLSDFDTSNVTDMHSMFYLFKSPCSLDLRSFNTEKVTNTHDMFDACTATEINLDSFDMSGITSDEHMFLKCTSPSIYAPKQVSRTVFLNSKYYDESNNVFSELPKNLTQTKHLTTTPQEITSETTWQNDYIYDLDNTIKRITLKKYIGTSSSLVVSSKAIINGVTYTTALAGGTAIWQPSGSPSTNTVKSLVIADGVIIPSDCSNMFSNLQNLTELDISHFNTSSVTNMSNMFSNLAQLESLDLRYFNTE